LGKQALESALVEIAQHRILTVSNSMDLPSYQRNLQISKQCSLVLPTFGVHPWNAPQYADRLEDLSEAIEQSPMLGEIGLDHYFVQDTSAYPAQRKVLEFFLGAAKEQGNIAMLHTKGAEREVLGLLDQYDLPRVMVHWYSGPLDVLTEMVARGAYFTVGIEVLYSEHIQTIAQAIPSRRLLTETDNPGGPKGFIGEPGMPALIQWVIEGVAKARKTTAESIIQTVQANMLELIRDDPRLSDVCAVLEQGQSGS
ncbi:MAG: TatD family hydrolase, partial [Anaerolineae bacterium]